MTSAIDMRSRPEMLPNLMPSGRPWPAGRHRRLHYTPELEVVILVVVAGDESVLIAPFGMDVVLGDEERRLHEAARRLVVEGPIELVDCLIGLELDRFRHRDHLVLPALADAVIGRAVAVGGDELH